MLDTTLWATQLVLALFFLFAGLPKILGRGIDRWTGFADLPRPLTLLIGIAEVAAPIALVAPMLLGVAEWTTPLAAVGLAVVSLMASGFHVRAGEWLTTLETALWAALAGTVAVGRWDLLATGPSLAPDLLVPAVGVLVVALVVNLVAIFRTPARPAESLTPR
ncbi:DoxX family protein [Myceligenerans pegani]|uniref:DoxX family protein n=1 Tax=Myceligenerans pegani TaxID=2776917 RepID=A0ABR9N4H5_9MICO|nr:DoxX family protein [Myceligenerans sp. TRM 65318]MBE1878245.1 DoxX family protein [Myceligenerans sp. TRM 65318]MBE3020516.1 DoxX family protein [Myceligenerans sp. TRM 65318]